MQVKEGDVTVYGYTISNRRIKLKPGKDWQMVRGGVEIFKPRKGMPKLRALKFVYACDIHGEAK